MVPLLWICWEHTLERRKNIPYKTPIIQQQRQTCNKKNPNSPDFYAAARRGWAHFSSTLQAKPQGPPPFWIFSTGWFPPLRKVTGTRSLSGTTPRTVQFS